MADPKKTQTMKRLKQELIDLQKNVVLTLGITADKDTDIFHWKVTMFGPEDSPYAGGLFNITIEFPVDYPQHKPRVKFITKMYHHNVMPDGSVCISTLFEWDKRLKESGNPPTIAEVLSDIWWLFKNQGDHGNYGKPGTQEYQQKKAAFEAKAKEWTQKYASY